MGRPVTGAKLAAFYRGIAEAYAWHAGYEARLRIRAEDRVEVLECESVQAYAAAYLPVRRGVDQAPESN